MCNVCGCGQGETRVETVPGHHHPSPHHHSHGHSHHRRDAADLDFGATPAGVHVPGFTDTEVLEIEREILSKNEGYASGNRAFLEGRRVLALNLVSSPGSGKTTLLTETIRALGTQLPVAVIEGDQETLNDAERIRETGAEAVQINTGRGCHLDAHMVGHALERLTLAPGAVLFIENVGNLVCPASFALGERHKVALLSVTEGDDKPLKYPDIFAAADLMIINKLDLLPYVDFDTQACAEYARRVNPAIEIIELSARTGEGMTAWIEWIHRARSAAGVGPEGRGHEAPGHAARRAGT